MAAIPDDPGLRFADQYEWKRELGRGTFGYVAEVFDHHLQRRVALKVFESTGAQEVWAEAQVLERLRGPYILEVRHAALAEGRPFVVTEVADRGTVADRIEPGVGVPPHRAVQWAREACRGVARMHDDGLVHRDIKPDNLFLTQRDDILVGDLGNARLLDGDNVAPAGGTPETTAPEVAQAMTSPERPSHVYTKVSDVYSLGATLYWMLTGQAPCPTGSHADAATMAAPDVWDNAPHVSPGLRGVTNRAIAQDPAGRHESAMALDTALGNFNWPLRAWTRTAPHPGHEQCFSGTKGGSTITVCAMATGHGTRFDIEARHTSSGRRVRKAERTASSAALPRALRSAMRAADS